MKAVEVFRSACPDGFLRDLAGGLVSAYALADTHVRGMLRRDEEIANTYPWVRRGLIEQMLRDVGEGYPNDITTKVERGNFWFRAELTLGGVTLTQCAAYDPEASLRPAVHRTELAKMNQQMLPFLEMLQMIDIPEGSDLYATLLHGRRADSLGHVGIATIRFPRPNIADGFFDESLDLMHEYPEVFADVDTPPEAIEDSAIPELHDTEQTGSE